MSPHEILIAIMAAFAVLGALDRIFGNRVGLGPEFENGILSLGSLALSMAKGVLSGIVTIPVGVLVGGLVAGFPVGMVLRNLIPIVLIALLIALGLWKWERGMIRGLSLIHI